MKMPKQYILSEDGKIKECPDLIEWAKWMAAANRKIAFDEINDVRISTIFLGLDRNYFDGPPTLFETMIFGGEHDQYQERYSTKEEALIGHQEAIALVKNEN